MYNHSLIEEKWQKLWEEKQLYKFVDDLKKKKYFALNEFPYPSGSALHLGHGMGWTFIDVHARYKNSKGYCVLCPIGWDAFGLPAEQFAIKNNKDPNVFTQNNIEKMRCQIKQFGTMVPWNKEIDTTDKNYYAMTQWVFSKLFEKGLAVLEESDVNWCEQLNTVLANDEIIVKDGKMYSERGEYKVIKKPMKQWVLKITNYAKKLVDTLDEKTWRGAIVQKQWIGISEGALVDFKLDIKGFKKKITVFTTRIDTIYGVSFIVLAPENEIVKELVKYSVNKSKINKYVELTNSKTELERKENKEKTGVDTLLYAINPFNNQKIPVFLSDYVLNNYGTGAVMGVPAHDQRDYEFAKKFKLNITPVIEGGDIKKGAYEEDGKHINSKLFNGLNKQQAIKKGLQYITAHKCGKKFTTTKLHDWVFSRQRYWGEPFPIVYDPKTNKPKLVKQLPVVLPKLSNYSRMENEHGVYQNPLANAKDWINVTIDKKKYVRETSTMPGSAGSSAYWMGYILKNDDGTYLSIDSAEGQKRLKRWLAVDVYCGGTEHTTGHMLYARFWHSFLKDLGYVSTSDFFVNRVEHGLILAEDGRKMSKRWGNVINPGDVINSHGADAFRCAVSFLGPIDDIFPWNNHVVDGMRKWLDRVYNFFTNNKDKISNNAKISDNLNVAYNVFVKNVEKQLQEYKHNTAISEMMIFINECYKEKTFDRKQMIGFLVVLSFFAPHLAEEINSTILNNKDFIFHEKFPTYNEKLTISSSILLPIQINGKLRATISIDASSSEKDVLNLALKNDNVKRYIPDGKYKKVIYIKNKILNIII